MICKIEGVLEMVEDRRALVRPEGGLTYEILVSTYTAARLGGGIGRPVSLHTLHYLEGSGQGANYTPRLAGFVSLTDKAFFELFITVKGIGSRKALKSLALSTPQIAGAIVERDVKLLQSLPEIGKRMAETIVAELSGKVDRFVEGAVSGAASAVGRSTMAGDVGTPPGRALTREALEVLVQLGENRVQALQWIDDILRRDSEISASHELVSRVLELKAGV